jgi:26S proteasome regulatory subunit N7
VDKVSGVIATTRADTRNSQYYETIKLGDALMHRMQKLSRVINI